MRQENGTETTEMAVVDDVKDLKGHKHDRQDAAEDQVDQWREPIRRCYLGVRSLTLIGTPKSKSGNKKSKESCMALWEL